MKKKLILASLLLGAVATEAGAQRVMDTLDRGLVAVKTTEGVFCSWRIPGEEWYDVKYNLYRDGVKLNAEPLNVSNFVDTGGTQTSKYTVRAVIGGSEQEASKAVAPFATDGQYLAIPMQPVYAPMVPVAGKVQRDVTSLYEPNDATIADVDGDGEYEIFLKRENNDMSQKNDTASTRFEVYKLDGTKLWQLDVGPNMQSLSNVETNIIVADFDQDGKQEAVLRVGDGAVLNDGTVIGEAGKNYRNSYNTSQPFQCEGKEYLLLLDAQTGKLLDNIPFPLERGNVNDWGDGYGHRANKFFFGAPFLDGRHPSLVMARGIYTKTIMCAYDIVGKKFQERWTNKTDFLEEPWAGQGYHNFGIADVDNDGKDEIVYGSMVVDDNGKGLYTTGLGHGDAQHCGDFDPYRKGLEIFACLEDNPGTNYRDAATGEILWRTRAGSDVGRCIAANVTNDFDGYALQGNGQFASASEKTLDPNAANHDRRGSVAENYALFWDGSLLQQTFNYETFDANNGRKGVRPTVYNYEHPEKNFVMSGAATNNDTKGTPCLQADIFGDWREEVVVRSADNKEIRIYTTTEPCDYRIYTLMHDMQYKNAIQWQMCGYNQPPHQSFFLGTREGITVPPPPVMTNGRTEIAGSGSITSATDGQHVILCEMEGGNVNINGAKPAILTVNSPKDYTLTGSLSGTGTRLVKQGSGKLTLSGEQTHTGETNLWDGTTVFGGSLTASPVWLNRFAELNATGTIGNITAEYGSIIRVGADDEYAKLSVENLTLKRGAVVRLDAKTDGTAFEGNDVLNIGTLTIDGQCTLHITPHNNGAERMAAGEYLIATYTTLNGSADNIVLEGVAGSASTLKIADGKIYLSVPQLRANTAVTWTGSEGSDWETVGAKNFTNGSENDFFVSGDEVVFGDDAVNTTVNVKGSLSPKSVSFSNANKDYVLDGDSIVGATALTKTGDGDVTINNINRYTGGTFINGGRLAVSKVANDEGATYGALGGKDRKITVSNGATLAITESQTMSQPLVIGTGGANIEVAAGKSVILNTNISTSSSSKVELTKTGNGSITLPTGSYGNVSKLVIAAGSVYSSESGTQIMLPGTVEFRGGTLYDAASDYSYSTNSTKFVVEKGRKGTFYTDPRCNYTGSLTGAGQLTLYGTGIRDYLQGDWSAFTGTINTGVSKRGQWDPMITFNNSKGLPKATIMVNNGVTVSNNGKNFPIGAISGRGTLSGSGTYTIGALDKDFSFNGVIDSPVIKTGTGTWSVSVGGNIKGDITVNNGTLAANHSGETALNGNYSITASGSGMIRGTGVMGTVTLQSGGTLVAGKGSVNVERATGETTINRNLRAGSGSTVMLLLAKKGTSEYQSSLKIGGTFTLEGSLVVNGMSGYTDFAAGDEYVMWTAGSFSGDASKIAVTLPELPEGLEWNTDELFRATGKLSVRSTTGIGSIEAGAEVSCEVYTVSGVKAGSFTAVKAEAKAEMGKLGLSAGTYLLRMSTDRTHETVKVVIR